MTICRSKLVATSVLIVRFPFIAITFLTKTKRI